MGADAGSPAASEPGQRPRGRKSQATPGASLHVHRAFRSQTHRVHAPLPAHSFSDPLRGPSTRSPRHWLAQVPCRGGHTNELNPRPPLGPVVLGNFLLLPPLLHESTSEDQNRRPLQGCATRLLCDTSFGPPLIKRARGVIKDTFGSENHRVPAPVFPGSARDSCSVSPAGSFLNRSCFSSCLFLVLDKLF